MLALPSSPAAAVAALVLVLCSPWPRSTLARSLDASTAGGCSLSVEGGFTGRSTALLVDTRSRPPTWLLPTRTNRSKVLRLDRGQTFVASCPGSRNQVIGLQHQHGELECDGGALRAVASSIPKAINSRDLTCKKPAHAELRPGSKCSEGGRWFNVGFNVSGLGFVPLFGVCHNVDLGSTLYAAHRLHGASIDAAQDESKRPAFTQGLSDLFVGYSPDDAYKKSRQQATLMQLLGVKRAKEVLDVSSLVRGHLSPDGDFLWAPHQWATYFYANVAPQFSSINGGHWKVVENLARKLASQMQAELMVYTGTHGVLTLTNGDGKKVAIYLEPNKRKIPVPEHIWKVIYHPANKSGIALAVANNPTLSGRDRGASHLCEDKCAEHGWPKDLLKDVRKGLVVCCTIQQLKQAGVRLPANIRAEKVLRGPSR
ncbi:Nuclease EXOG, mitochondrial [Frankliniella fusca]|uniref:Nuclease EXOG, mitochondrial n=1 Tax=Frankliniella fusca TaxID=407009 RepID=A0AAE1LH50_9NEOP|nr:Nuclease EXOG, mitochondrial [Frankliniella fusca]